MPRARNGRPTGGSKKRGTAVVPKDAPSQDAPPPQEGDGEKRKMTMHERMQFAQRIAQARTKPKPDTWAVIAKREGIPARTCQYIYAQFQAGDEKLHDTTGARVLNETLHYFEALIEKLAFEAEHGDNTSARVGAMKLFSETLKNRVELLSVMGRMPRSFRAMDELVALQRLTRGLAEIVERHGMSAEIVGEFMALADDVQPVIEGRAIRELPQAS